MYNKTMSLQTYCKIVNVQRVLYSEKKAWNYK